MRPGLRAALAAGTVEAIEPFLRPGGAGILRLPLLPPAACQAFLSEIEQAERVAPEGSLMPPNSMHEAGWTLGEHGFAPLFDAMLQEWVRPLAQAYFQDFVSELESVYGYLVDYARGKDEFLGWHVDDADVTLNLCLGDDFSGSEIYFNGLRCERHRQGPWSPEEEFELDHIPGTAIVHAGAHRHGVRDLRRGRRRNLILWCKGERAPEAKCPAWCGADPDHSPA